MYREKRLCLQGVPGGGLEPFRRVLRSGGWLPLKKNTLCFTDKEAQQHERGLCGGERKQNLVKVPFHFVSQQKTRSSAVVFDVALAVRPF